MLGPVCIVIVYMDLPSPWPIVVVVVTLGRCKQHRVYCCINLIFFLVSTYRTCIFFSFFLFPVPSIAYII
ncbi:hypothetical protein B0F90DRAFT_1355022 [Multifurca ochricompacta]|uniref:Uncharacterized protein n=1 Tax=Multifurca ochricompacta TaxID=376703 RepID=A0AAD4LZC7_9AGAM|nr:hypothetical protein B0F90DRAFT_1355022 [Multifurca ochricompacta]